MTDIKTDVKTDIKPDINKGMRTTLNDDGDEVLTLRIQSLAVQAYNAVGCRGWARVDLAHGESKRISLPIENDRLTIYNETSDRWTRLTGDYMVMVGGSSQSLPLQMAITLP